MTSDTSKLRKYQCTCVAVVHFLAAFVLILDTLLVYYMVVPQIVSYPCVAILVCRPTAMYARSPETVIAERLAACTTKTSPNLTPKSKGADTTHLPPSSGEHASMNLDSCER